MAGIDAFSPAKAVALGVLLEGVNPKNLLLTLAAAVGLAQLGLSTTDAVISLLVFVVVASLTIAPSSTTWSAARMRRPNSTR